MVDESSKDGREAEAGSVQHDGRGSPDGSFGAASVCMNPGWKTQQELHLPKSAWVTEVGPPVFKPYGPQSSVLPWEHIDASQPW